MINIVFLDALAVGDADISIFESLGNFTCYAETQSNEVIARCSQADVVITNKVQFFAKEIDQLPQLKLICISATGMNNVDVEYAHSKGIDVKNVVAYSTDSVAQATFALALSLIHHTHFYDKYVKSKEYSHQTLFTHHSLPFFELKGKTWGIIGLGNIGRKVAEIAIAFGAKVVYYSTSGKNMNGNYLQQTLPQLLAKSDIISIHSPLNEQTQNLIKEAELAQMKETAILINVGRGGIVNENDLANVLRKNTIAGAGIDVFSEEPINENHPLLDEVIAHKILFTPHNAWASKEAREKLLKTIYQHIQNFIESDNSKK